MSAASTRSIELSQLTGGSTVLYSSDAIDLAISKFDGQFVTLSWREK